MKKIADPRHLKRIDTVQKLFEYSFQKSKAGSELEHIIAEIPKIDPLIQSAASQFPIEKIAKMDLAILRLAVYELLHISKIPRKVIIDEAIELAKEFAGEGSPAFINGVLGHILKEKGL